MEHYIHVGIYNQPFNNTTYIYVTGYCILLMFRFQKVNIIVTFISAELSSEVAGLRLAAGEAPFSACVSFLTRSILPNKLDMSMVLKISTIPSFLVSSVSVLTGLVLLPMLACFPPWCLSEVAW